VTVDTVHLEKLVMATTLSDLTLLEDNNLVYQKKTNKKKFSMMCNK
jgi:hypothetical protein